MPPLIGKYNKEHRFLHVSTDQPCDLEDGELYYIKVEKYKGTKTQEQRSYFHAIVLEYGIKGFEEKGYGLFAPYQLKAELKKKFLTEEYFVDGWKMVDGEKIPHTRASKVIRDTEDLNLMEYKDFIQRCLEYFAEIDIHIPPPPNKILEYWVKMELNRNK